MFSLHGLTDICKDGNLLKVNSCNCTTEFDGPKKVVSMTIIKNRKLKRSSKGCLKKIVITHTPREIEGPFNKLLRMELFLVVSIEIVLKGRKKYIYSLVSST